MEVGHVWRHDLHDAGAVDQVLHRDQHVSDKDRVIGRQKQVPAWPTRSERASRDPHRPDQRRTGMTRAIALPVLRSMTPPLLNTVPLATPPVCTHCAPPLLTTVPVAWPPFVSDSKPPLTTVKLATPFTRSWPWACTIVPLITPPEATLSMPAYPTTVPLAKPPEETLTTPPPPFTCTPLATPPVRILTAPPDNVLNLAMPPDDTTW